MNKVIEFLKENPVQYLATVGRDGKAKCRPFMFAGEMDGKLWFCTNNTKDVYLDMQSNPEIEISVSSPSYAWIRLHGTWLQKKCALPIRLLKDSMRLRTIRFLRYFTWMSRMV